MFYRILAAAFAILAVIVIYEEFTMGAQRSFRTFEARFEDTDTTNRSSDDYVVFYVAGKLVREGNGADLYDRDAFPEATRAEMGRPVGGTGSDLFYNPPFVAGVWALLSFLDLDPALATWATLVAALALAIAVVGPLLLGARGAYAAVLTAGLLASPATIALVTQVQFTVFVIIGMVGFVYFEERGRPASAGAMLLVTLVKPQYAILPFGYLMLRHGPRPAIPLFIGVGVLIFLSAVIGGPAVLWEYPQLLLASSRFDGEFGIAPGRMSNWYVLLPQPVSWIAAVGTVAAAMWITRSMDAPRATAILVLATTLASTHVYFHDTTLLIVAVWFAVARSDPFRGSLTLVAVLFAQVLAVDFLRGTTDVNWGAVAMVVVMIAVAWSHVPSPRSEPARAPQRSG